MVDWLVSYFKGCAWGIREREREGERGGRRWLNARECLEVSLISGDTANRAPSYPPSTGNIASDSLATLISNIYSFCLRTMAKFLLPIPQNS